MLNLCLPLRQVARICALLLLSAVAVSAEVTLDSNPRISSWFTKYSSKYARVYTNDTMKLAGTSITTWGNGSQNQTLPTYCGVQEIYSSTNWVYIRNSGLGSHIMGPWYNTAARTVLFVNMPSNQKTLVRFPKTPTIPTTKQTTGGTLGYFVDGVCMFDARDAVSYSYANATDGNPPGSGGVTGDGIWNRDAYMNEGQTMDPALSHQQNTGVYHAHSNPIATRYLLGDHIDFNSTTKLYSESTTPVTQHSPIIGWMFDGHPLYGPYGYSTATNANSGVRRMVSGYVLRNGQNGTTNLTVRTNLPQWAARAGNRSATLASTEYGPTVSTSFPLGRYTEDNEYLGDLGKVQAVDFDLDQYNGRYCVTPEFPGGTYAYFVTISSNGTPTYPYNGARQSYGTITGGVLQNISETVATNFLGGTNLAGTLNNPVVGANTVTLSWSAVEGGSYKLESTTNLSTWSTVASNLSPQQISGSYTNARSASNQFYRVARTALASFDSVGTTSFTLGAAAPGGTASRGTTVTLTITLPSNPPNPPANATVSSVTLGTISGTGLSCPSQGTVLATFAIPANATTGSQNIVVTFNPGPTYTMSGALTIQ
jgi:hypothetical protein